MRSGPIASGRRSCLAIKLQRERSPDPCRAVLSVADSSCSIVCQTIHFGKRTAPRTQSVRKSRHLLQGRSPTPPATRKAKPPTYHRNHPVTAKRHPRQGGVCTRASHGLQNGLAIQEAVAASLGPGSASYSESCRATSNVRRSVPCHSQLRHALVLRVSRTTYPHALPANLYCISRAKRKTRHFTQISHAARRHLQISARSTPSQL